MQSNNKGEELRGEEIIKQCYRRALFTRTHDQLSLENMFLSLSDCRKELSLLMPKLKDKNYTILTTNIISCLDEIERYKIKLDLKKIDALKLESIRNIVELSKLLNRSYIIPKALTEEMFFSREDANKPPSLCIPLS